MKKEEKPKFYKSAMLWIFIIITAIFISNYIGSRKDIMDIPYSEFRRKLVAGQLERVKIGGEHITGTFMDMSGNMVKFKTIAVNDPDLVKTLEEKGIRYEGRVTGGWFQAIFFNFGPLLLFILIWLLILGQFRMGGKQVMSFGRSKASLYMKGKDKNKNINFDSVAGLDEAKEELQEIVEYLKNPESFTRLGAEIPKGFLLYGAPGTGKTLLAKAIAGEAGVPFFSTSGSEFVEMFVGVGAARIRDLFDKSRRNAPSLIFIDELDAVGRSRFSGLGGGHDEREQTLNQILTELDGFNPREGVILIGATNRPDVLDSALLRRGRFDRHINIAQPNQKERKEIFQLHAKKIKISGEVDFDMLARRTPGFVGSDIANIINEAALLAGREKAKKVVLHHIEEAIDRVIAGPEVKSRIISDEERRKISYHESGHTLVALNLPNADPVHKVSILSRGPALGYTLQLPIEDKYLASESEIMDKLTVMLAGRSAEELIFNEKTTGAHDDLRRATDIAYKVVAEYGMSDEIGPLTFQRDRDKIFLGRELAQGKEYSDKTAQLIDEGVKNVIEKCHKRARQILKDNEDKLRKLAEELIKREVIEGNEIKKILGLNGQGEDKKSS